MKTTSVKNILKLLFIKKKIIHAGAGRAKHYRFLTDLVLGYIQEINLKYNQTH